ncbi:DUF1700 domain-containing protein [Clostridium cylindrosporum]|uniref:DUF1700 domain-containing protein n=1 Tax=Clostridium cylindrosporum DSM 605 TaxID=1121307 RepID=A0A0J8DD97_CLOCY|nr:DUF1700 domain-containing protein [Clostridium cylindrosporum]KMT22214.1 hypothetical protein CLCY_4c01870 [Clostridium cylindrosporum DSM 605]
MNKKDFLEILKDYLKGHFTEYEINDILRDYEEFFLNGKLEGKSEEEVITSLGSPKAIATELIMEIKGENKGDKESFSSKTDYKSMYRKAKNLAYEGFDKCRNFLNSSDIINGKFPTWIVIGFILVFTVAMLPFALSILGSMFTGFIGLIFSSVGSIFGLVFSFTIMPAEGTMGAFVFFLSLIAIGALIICWTIFIHIARFLKYIILSYISWVKTRFMYIRVKKKKDESDSEVNEDILEGKEKEGNIYE